MSKRRGSWMVAVVALWAVVAAGLAMTVSPTPSAADANEAPAAPSSFRELATGSAHTCAILRAGRVKCWGSGSGGRLGLGDTNARGDAAGEMGLALPAVDLGFGRTATELSAGATHTCALLDNGAVKCWGNNALGRLGLGDTNNRGDAAGEMGDNLPAVSLGTGRTATAISAGNSHTCALLDNAAVKCWGNNASGQLGLGNNSARGDGANEMGDALPAVALGTGRTATAISVGNGFSCALLDNSTVKCWGNSASGQLGQGNTTQRGDNAGEMGDNLPAVDVGTGRTVTALTTGDTHTCVLLDNHQVKCWGAGGSGRLGLGDTATRGDGAGEMGDDLPTVSLGDDRRATGLSAGANHTCAVVGNTLTGGTAVKCWGENASGQLGLGNTADRGDGANEMGNDLFAVDLGAGRNATAVSTASAHTCARLDDGSVKCWGDNPSGQLGLGDIADRGDAAGEMGDNLPAADLAPGRIPLSVAAGSSHTCAVLDAGAVKCWGYNFDGELGQGDSLPRGDEPGELGDASAPVALGTGRTATAIAVGSGTCALLDNGTVKCWGDNQSGVLGLGDSDDRGDGPGEMGDALPAVDLGSGRTATAIESRSRHTCALLDNGTVKCWGLNFSGQLGQGDTDDRGDGPGEMGDALPAIDLGTGRTATAIAVGGDHTCALLDTGDVKCWGKNDDGQLGQGDTVDRGDGPAEMGDALPAIDLGTGRTATAIATGGAHTCALLDNASLKCWGHGGNGRLGAGTADRGDGPNEMGDNRPAVSLGTGRTATHLALTTLHTCARLDNGVVKCWGSNIDGRLGLGDTNSRGDNANEMGDNLPAVDLGTDRTATAVNGGGVHTCAALDNGTVKCWGTNLSGRLGIGDTVLRGDTPDDMGDNLPAVDLGSATPLGVSGTVTAAGSGAPVPGAFVALLRTTDFAIAGGTVADPAGNYAAEAPPGSYFVYAIDPAGRHSSGFAGAPTPVDVATPGLVDADAALATTRGTISGTITETGSGAPIAGGWALTLSATGLPEIASSSNGGGGYQLRDLTAGDRYVGWVDPSGNRSPRFSPNSPNVPDATTVPVTAGGTAVRNGSLPVQTSTPGGATLTGTVTETGTNVPLANVLVIAQHAADFRLARAATTDSSGGYSLDVAAGSYKLVFFDTTGRHAMEWHDNQPYFQLGNAANVTAPATTNAALDPTTGTITGTLTDGDTGQPLAGAWAFAIGPTGSLTGTITKANGTYRLSGLAPGTYRATFADPVGGRAQEYFNNSSTYDGGTNVNITAGAVTANVDTALSRP